MSGLDSRKITNKVSSTISDAIQLAKECGHAQLQPLHMAVCLCEDSAGLAKSCTLRAYSEDTWHSLCRVLRARLGKLPKVRKRLLCSRQQNPMCSLNASGTLTGVSSTQGTVCPAGFSGCPSIPCHALRTKCTSLCNAPHCTTWALPLTVLASHYGDCTPLAGLNWTEPCLPHARTRRCRPRLMTSPCPGTAPKCLKPR